MTDSSIVDTLSAVVDEATVPSQEAEVKTEETKAPEAQAPVVEETTEEVFADKGDLKGKTPEELEETYNAWQKAYAAKRQKETAELRELKAKIAEIESKTQVEPQGTTQDKVDEAQKQVELGNMTMTEYTQYVRNLLAEDARRIAREEVTAVTTEQQESSYQEQAVNDFRQADPRLDEHNPDNVYDEKFANDIRRELADLLDEHLEKTGSYKGFDTKSIAKQIVERRDAEIDEIIKKRTQQSTQAAKMREAKMRKSEVRGTTVSSQKIGGDSIKDILSDTLDNLG